MSHFEFTINPEGSKFSFEELKLVFEQNHRFIEQTSNHTFAPITETDTDPEFREKSYWFKPKSEFGSRNVMALAERGSKFNIDNIKYLDLHELRGLALHELGHNVRLVHTDNKYSVMSVNPFRSRDDKSLLWRADLLKLHEVAPLNPNPVGLVTVDNGLSVMIPALTFEGKQWGVKLKVISGGKWMVDKYYEAEDDVQMVEKAFMTETELRLEDVSYLGFVYPLVRFKITPDLRFILKGADDE
jgi:hypothetical protein